jgi:endonuclease/exonuclease/phosphatase family metal-dependent hydrolase
MELITLNTWGGRAGKTALLDFFNTYRNVDIFCLQEVWNGGEHMSGRIAGGVVLSSIAHRLMSEVGLILTTHDVYFKPHYHDWYGLAMFVKKDLRVIDEGDMYVYKEKGWTHEVDEGNHARNIQWVAIETVDGPRTIINFHGLWNGQGKSDTDDRLLQSDKIITFLKDLAHPYVLAGDFNLRPDTESVAKLEEFGMDNLIRRHNIQGTRTSFYTKPEKFADYVFVSNGIDVKEFRVLPEEVSDHAALYLKF